jgi:hypothetical protein
MFPYNESEWEFISVIKDNRSKIKMTVEDLNEDDNKNELLDPPTKAVEKIKESLESKFSTVP